MYGINVSDARASKNQPAYAAALLAFLVGTAALSIYLARPPAAAPPDAPPESFSAARALRHLRAIARHPRPIGSAEHRRAREYILAELSAQGFETSAGPATALGPTQYHPFRAATVHNVTGRLRGTRGGKAVLLVAHYDSVPTGPGASDDGAGVAALLEAARALRAGPPLKNDVVILLTDGEEIGLLGASAYVAGRGGAGEVVAVFNFEARGTSGQAVMFETSDGNGRLIREFAEASPAPSGNSMLYEIYKRLLNDTDFSPFKRAGYAGLNFAYINELPRYHSKTDSVENLDADSLQHHGANALALARHFGNLDLGVPAEGNAVYFNPAGSAFVHYPGWLVLPLALLLLLAYVGVVALGFRKGLLTWRGLGLGFLALLSSGAVTYAAVTLALRLVRALHEGEEFVPWGDTYNSGYYVLSLAALACAVVTAVVAWFGRRAVAHGLAAGAMLWWLMPALFMSVYVPGGSYLFVWPLAFALAGQALIFLDGGDRGPAWAGGVNALCAVPALFLLVPMIHTLFSTLTFNAAGAVLLLLVLLFGLLVPALGAAADAGGRWLAPAVSAAAAAALLAAGLAHNTGFDANHPKTSTVFYGLNADSGRAVWASFDPRPDEWTTQFFPAGGRSATLSELIPTSDLPFLQGDAPAAALTPPELVLLGEESRGETRLLRLRVTSPRGAEVVSVYPDANSKVVGAWVNGQKVPLEGGATPDVRTWALQYYGLPPEGAEVSLELTPQQPVTLRVTDRSYGLPQLPGLTLNPRPDHLMPTPGSPGDMTLVGKSFRF